MKPDTEIQLQKTLSYVEQVSRDLLRLQIACVHLALIDNSTEPPTPPKVKATMDTAKNLTTLLFAVVPEIRRHLDSLRDEQPTAPQEPTPRAYNPDALDEALNSGDGTYRP